MDVEVTRLLFRKELNLGNDSAGIMVLDDNIINGTLASEYFKIEEDYIYEIG